MRVHLFVPPDPAILEKAVASGTDTLWLEKPRAADTIRAARQRSANLKLYVCLGAVDGTLDDALDTAMAAAPDGIVLPVRNSADVQHLGVKLAVREAELGLADGAIRIIARVAAPGAVFQIERTSPRLVALAFDAQAFAAALGTEDALAGPASLARNLTLLTAKAAGIEAILIDAANTDLRATCKAAKRDGFDAIAVHDPASVAIVRAALK